MMFHCAVWSKLGAILPKIEELQKRKCDTEVLEGLEQIQSLENEIYGSSDNTSTNTIVDETDLSLRKLEELHREVQALHMEMVFLFILGISSILNDFLTILF
ncbi:65-kDa microtubule-associated protein 3 [Abeliophyllum distichum]|uniref:65-kDa microtubule-associated protein 3 n=1 Tax=Abeliophyllum distichum TaxID=126358 RepID=A0ABD1V5K3_9LAMI